MIQVVADVVQHPPSPEQPLPFSALHFYLSSITWGVIINYVVVHYIFDLIFLISICIFIMLLSCRTNALSLSPLWNSPTANAFLDCLDNHSFSLNLFVLYEQHTGKESMSVSHWSSGSSIIVLRVSIKTLAIAYSFLLHSDTSHSALTALTPHDQQDLYDYGGMIVSTVVLIMILSLCPKPARSQESGTVLQWIL